MEDLWAFNDERVVRAVASSPAPVISGVGHETDFTLTDFAADLRAPTPTGAAVAAVPDIAELIERLRGQEMVLLQLIRSRLDACREDTLETDRRLISLSPGSRIRQSMQRLDGISMRLNHLQENFFLGKRVKLDIAAEKLAGFDPRSILHRGFAIISDDQGGLISSAKQVQLGQQIHALLSDGKITSEVNRVGE